MESNTSKTDTDIARSDVAQKRRLWRDLVIAFVLAFAILTALTPNMLAQLSPPTGDEPSYLMTAITIIEQHTLDETATYARQEEAQFYPFGSQYPNVLRQHLAPDFRGWGSGTSGLSPYPLPPHDSQTVRAIHPSLYISKHGLGLSVLIVPAYALGGREGVVHFLNLLAALLGTNLYLLGWEVSKRRGVAWLVWLSFMFTAPVLCYAFLIFPEMPAALLVIYAFRRARLAAHARLDIGNAVGVNGPLRLTGIALCIGVLPWLHGRFLPVAIALFLYTLFGGQVLRPKSIVRETLRLNRIGLIVAALILLAFAALYLSYYIAFFGSPVPNTLDHAGFNDLRLTLFGLAGLVFDSQWGLLVYSPVYLVGIVGLLQLWRGYGAGSPAARARRGRSDLVWLLLVLLPYYGIIANYKQWWGEWGPPARYLLSVVPLLALPLAAALSAASAPWEHDHDDRRNWWAEFAFWTVYQLLLAYSILVAIGFQVNLKLMYNQPTGQSALFHQVSLWLGLTDPASDIANLLPGYVGSLDFPQQVQMTVQAIGVGAVALLTAGVLLTSLIVLRHRPIAPVPEPEPHFDADGS